MKTIICKTDDAEILVDDEDYPVLSRFPWYRGANRVKSPMKNGKLTTSKYKGVNKPANSKKFIAIVCKDRKIHRCGSYENEDAGSSWFNGAADHLFELEIPSVLPVEKQKEIKEWQDKCIAFRLCMDGEKCTIEDCLAATQKAKDFLREWDAFHGIKTIKGGWE